MSYKRFGDKVSKHVSQSIQATYELDRHNVRQVLSELLFETPPVDTPQLSLTPYEVFLETLQLNYVEIGLSRENLMSVERYLPRIPAISKVSPTVQLRYHITNYMNEIYILQNRMLAFLTYIEKIYRNEARAPQLKAAISRMRADITHILSGIITTRGGHVHDAHYEDKELFRLAFLEYAARDLDQSFKPTFKAALKAELQRRRRWVRTTNKQIKKLLDKYFAALSVAVFDSKGQVKLPHTMRRLTRQCSRPTAPAADC